MKAIGFNLGMYGDICMGVIAAKQFKIQYSDWHLTLGISQKYSQILPLFEQNKYFDSSHVYEGYDSDWPTKFDVEFLEQSKYDIIFDGMPIHKNPMWYLEEIHQTQELCNMHNLSIPNDLQIELNPWFSSAIPNNKNKIAIVSGGTTRGNEKSLSREKTIEIVNLVKKIGYEPIQIGSENYPELGDCLNKNSSFFSKIVYLLGCKALITVDTSWSWIASGYSFPTLGLYGFNYYPSALTSKNWQPINSNAIYLERANCNRIPVEDIEIALKTIL